MYQLIIVDDEVTIAEGVANLFPWREIGFAAKAFCDSTEAMKYIQNNHVDVVMSDIEMPQINGLELARQVYSCFILSKHAIISALLMGFNKKSATFS